MTSFSLHSSQRNSVTTSSCPRDMADERKSIVVIGGGIIGVCSAYFLTRHPAFDPAKHTVTLLEATKIAGGASGKAGGLLALWAYPSNIVPLSYRLHAELAKEHDGERRWGYRRLNCGQVDANGRALTSSTKGKGKTNDGERGVSQQSGISLQKRSEAALGTLRAAGFPDDLDWVAAEAAIGYEEMGGPDTTAQVHPYQFTTSIAALAEASGVEMETGAKVTSVNSSRGGGVESVTYSSGGESKTIPCSSCVLAAGPWTRSLLPSAPISGLRAHSVTIRPSRQVSPYALFTSIKLPAHFGLEITRPKIVTPEIYARPNNEVYACGEGDTLVPLPESTVDVVTEDSRCQEIVDFVGAISDELRDGEVTARQSCYLPVCDGSGGPFIGEVREMKGLIIASGHSCWGIQNGPGTGKLVSEIVLDGKARSAKLGQLDPKVGM